MKIIEAQPRHVPDVWRVISACVRAMRREGVYQWDEIYPNMDVVAEDARNGSLYVADSDGICLATVCLDHNQPPEYGPVSWSGAGQVTVIHRLCVDPAHQGQGIARRLLGFAEEEAGRSGSRWIRLDAYSGNPRAIRMYERRGYLNVGEIWFPRRELPSYCFEKAIAEDDAARQRHAPDPRHDSCHAPMNGPAGG